MAIAPTAFRAVSEPVMRRFDGKSRASELCTGRRRKLSACNPLARREAGGRARRANARTPAPLTTDGAAATLAAPTATRGTPIVAMNIGRHRSAAAETEPVPPPIWP